MPNLFALPDDELLALCAWREARGEGEAGIVGVMNTICNRARDWKWTIQHVILDHNQFTSMSVASDPEFNLFPVEGDPVYAQCLDQARQVLASKGQDDNTNGSHWYANLKHISENGWFDRNIVQHEDLHPVTAVIGGHTFYA